MSRNTRRISGGRQNVKLVDEGDKRRVLLVGGGAREHAIGEALCRTSRVSLHVFAHNRNPGLESLAERYQKGDETDVEAIVEWARRCGIDFAVIGLEDPLAVGLPDALQLAGVPTVGPVQSAARLETSKLFLRNLMKDFGIAGNLDFKYIADADELELYLTENATREYALKPVGLTAGKGVQVMGVQLPTLDAAIQYGRWVIGNRIGGTAGILLEERIQGPEFTMQAFVDASAVVNMPLIKDYKLAGEGDTGPNTGSMGSYSESNGSLHFLSSSEHDCATKILEDVIAALRSTGVVYRGIVYGQFMKTADGIKLIEINARFGDPEGINALALLENDFVDVCLAILNDSLSKLSVRFAPLATVCKYLTPEGYPLKPKVNQLIEVNVSKVRELGVEVFFAKVEKDPAGFRTTTSRSVALLATGATVENAHDRIEQALPFVSGKYYMRHDIGTTKLTRDAVESWVPKSQRNANRRARGG